MLSINKSYERGKEGAEEGQKGDKNGPSGALKIGAHKSFHIFSFFGFEPRSWIVGSYCTSVLNFCGNSMLFSIVAAPIDTPTKSIGRFPFISDLCSIYSLWIFLMMAVLIMVK